MTDYVMVHKALIDKLRDELENGEPTDWHSSGRDVVRYADEASPEPDSAPPCQGCAWEQSHRVSCCTHPRNESGKMDVEHCPILEPESAEPVAILCRQTDESKTEWFDHDPLIPGSTRHKIRANHGGWELLPVYASQPARGCEPITKYVELTREQAFEHLKTNSFHLERTGLYKLVINPDWKPQPAGVIMTRLTRPHSETEAELLKDSEYVKALSLELDETVKELERLRTENEALMQQAQIWKQEARTMRNTVAECYKAVTGSTGEPGDWNGAKPVREAIAELKAERDRLASAIHYPEHWDTTAYPTLYDALNEIGCNQCEEA